MNVFGGILVQTRAAASSGALNPESEARREKSEVTGDFISEISAFKNTEQGLSWRILASSVLWCFKLSFRRKNSFWHQLKNKNKYLHVNDDKS